MHLYVVIISASKYKTDVRVICIFYENIEIVFYFYFSFVLH